MVLSLKPILLGLGTFLALSHLNHLSAALRSRSEISTTDRMNTGGDPGYHPGLSGRQPGSYPVDDWSGPGNLYYSNYGNPVYDTHQGTQGYGEPYYGKPIYQGPYGIGYKEYADATYMRRKYPDFRR